MEITIEQVEKLKERTNVTYKEARDALQASDGDILEAVIALEKEGKTNSKTAAFSTNSTLPAMDDSPQNTSGNNSDTNTNQYAGDNNYQNNDSGNYQNTSNSGSNSKQNHNQNYNQNYNNQNGGQNYQNYNQYGPRQNTTFGDLMNRFFRFCGRVIHAGNVNQFVVHRFGRETLSLPVTALVLLLIFFFPITITILIVALFFEYKYSFSGPNLGKEEINRAMNNASDVADDLKEQFKADNNGQNSYDNPDGARSNDSYNTGNAQQDDMNATDASSDSTKDSGSEDSTNNE